MKRLLLEERMKIAGLEATRMLAGGIAHDFNNLLATIIGNIDMAMAESTPGDAVHDMLTSAELSSRKAADLVQQFLTFSKGGILIKKTVRLQGIIRDAVLAVIKDSDIKCSFYLYDSLWPVDCDPMQISQAIKNIILNSKQAMADDGILEVSAVNRESLDEKVPGGPAGKCVCIFIKDNGVGIPKRNLPRIFEPYFTTGSDVTRKGLGLGLSIVHAIITRHGGTIRITSEVGKGTTVRISLPVFTEK
jgi:signal transduction histidine kinase